MVGKQGFRTLVPLVGGLLMMAPAPELEAQTCEPSWTVEETLRIGSIDGDVTLTEVLDLKLGPGGEILLAQSMTPEVLVLSPEGEPIRTVGRAGDGPGEFSVSVNRLGYSGDELWVSHFTGLEIFNENEEPLRSIRFRAVEPEQSSVFTPGFLLADGTVVGNRQIVLTRDDRGAGFFGTDPAPLMRFSPSGAVVDTIAMIERAPTWVVEELLAEHPLHGWHDLSWLPVTASPDGASVVLTGNVQVAGGQSSFELLTIGIEGDTLLQRSISYEPKPVTRTQRDRLREEFAAYHAGDFSPSRGQGPGQPQDGPAMERRRQEARDAISFPEFHPPVRKVVAGHDGSMWLLRELTEDRIDHWEVYDAGGERIGTLHVGEGRSSELPWGPRMRILRATTEEVWATTLGEYDVPLVHRYQVIRGCQ